MFTEGIVDAFTNDPTVRLIGVLVVLDLLLGVSAAIYKKTFRLSYVADVFRNDVLGKVFPYYALWAALHVTGVDWSISGLEVIEEGAGGIVIAALLGSILNSIRDFGFIKETSDTIAGPDPASPTP